jgi:hypothetical protein
VVPGASRRHGERPDRGGRRHGQALGADFMKLHSGQKKFGPIYYKTEENIIPKLYTNSWIPES